MMKTKNGPAPACRLASGASLDWEGYPRLMLALRSCSCSLLDIPNSWGSLGGRSVETPCPFSWAWALRLLDSWIPAGWTVGVPLGLPDGSCPVTLLSLNSPAAGGPRSSPDFSMVPSRQRCQWGRALSMALCLARSRPWAAPGGVHGPLILLCASRASGGP